MFYGEDALLEFLPVLFPAFSVHSNTSFTVISPYTSSRYNPPLSRLPILLPVCIRRMLLFIRFGLARLITS